VGQVDRQLSAALPIAVQFASGFGPPTSVRSGAATALSDLYVAGIGGGARDVVLSPAAAAGREPRLPGRASSPGTAPSPVTVGSVRGSGSWRAVLFGLPDGSQTVVAVPLDQVDATERRVTDAVLAAGLAVLAAAGAAGWWLWRLGLRPIAEVTAVASAIAAGDRSRRVGAGVKGTEAAHLARAFNVMLDEQEAAEARLRRFVADASHELRTPVSAIGGFSDLWRQGGIAADQLSDVMRRIGQESARMRGLVEDLLLLAHLDEGRPLLRERVDIAALVADAALDASATHPSRSVTVETSSPVVVEGDEARLRQVIANLVSNALIHTDAATRVVLSASRRGTSAEFSVRDDGAGMSEQDAALAFDRFWQSDPARASNGAGLGLAIVRGIVDAHGGAVQLATGPGMGTTVTVALPVRHGGEVGTP